MGSMASLLKLTSQGDVGTISDESKLSQVKLMSPQQLYELWEQQNWVSHTIGFETDTAQWQELDEQTKGDIVWSLSSFFIGEERVTTQLSGLVMAYEEQVDEARHAQHFNRFYEQVVGLDMTFDERLRDVRRHVSDAFMTLFDEHLVKANQRLVSNPRDIEAKVDFVTAYHMVTEGTLALTGQCTITTGASAPATSPGSSRASSGSHRTSTATSPTARGSCSRSARTRRSRGACRTSSPSCCPWPPACSPRRGSTRSRSGSSWASSRPTSTSSRSRRWPAG